jgi:hypothetical protein
MPGVAVGPENTGPVEGGAHSAALTHAEQVTKETVDLLP